jgi:two-component system OmpR family sensor kinase
MRSFRSTLAFRVGLGALAVSLLLGLGALVFLRGRLLASLDASLLEQADLEAAYGADSLTAEFRFRSDRLRAPPSRLERGFWAQLLSSEGLPLLLSSNLSAPLPVPREALRAANAGRPAFATQRLGEAREGRGPGDIPLRTVIYPMGRAGPSHVDHRLQISTSLLPVRRTLGDFGLIASGLALIAAGLSWIGALAVASRTLEPALALTRSVEAIGVHEPGRRVTVPEGLVEFNRMAVAFNALLDRIERAVKGTRRFTADASHELRAPLTVLRGELELALTRPRSSSEYQEVLRCCLDEVVRLSRLADDLLTLARVEGGVIGGERSRVELDDLVGRALERTRQLAHARGVSVELSGSAGPIVGDPDLLVRALDGLLEHAIMATPEQAKVRVTLEAGDRTSRSVRVSDGGPGLAQDEVSGVFQRFYRSHRPRTRSTESGLGLAIARVVAERHGGKVEYAGNDPGASFRMSLPASSQESDG